MTDLRDPGPTVADDPFGGNDRRRWLSLSVVLVGTLMVVLDTTIVNVALPVIRDDIGAGSGIEWIVTAYLLAVAASQPCTAWLADRFGRKRVFLVAFVTFTLASLACALSPNLGVLIFFRSVQGLGGGAMMPVGMALIFEVFAPDQRGRAMGVWGIAAMAGPAVGPTLGGYLVTSVSWHWLFLINVPVGAVGFVLGVRLLRDSGTRDDRSLDVTGLVLGAGGLSITLLGVSQAVRWGWGAPATIACIVVGVTMLVSFVRHELRTDEPLVQLRVFKVNVFSLAISISLLTAAAQYTRLVFIPLQLEDLRGYTALRVGVVLIPQALFTAISMTIGGRFVDRTGPRTPVAMGCGLMLVATALMSQLHLGTPIGAIAAILALQGLGMGLTVAPATVTALNALPHRLVAQASIMRSLASQVAGAAAVSALSTLVLTRMGDDPSPSRAQDAYNSAFLVATVLVLVALVAALRLPRRSLSRRDDPAGTAALLAE